MKWNGDLLHSQIDFQVINIFNSSHGIHVTVMIDTYIVYSIYFLMETYSDGIL